MFKTRPERWGPSRCRVQRLCHRFRCKIPRECPQPVTLPTTTVKVKHPRTRAQFWLNRMSMPPEANPKPNAVQGGPSPARGVLTGQDRPRKAVGRFAPGKKRPGVATSGTREPCWKLFAMCCCSRTKMIPERIASKGVLGGGALWNTENVLGTNLE
eukprot:gene23207-biopygen2823